MIVKENKDIDGLPRLSQGQLSDCAARVWRTTACWVGWGLGEPKSSRVEAGSAVPLLVVTETQTCAAILKRRWKRRQVQILVFTWKW